MMEFDLKATQDASVEQKLKPYLSTLLMVDAEEAMQLWSTLSDLHHMLGDQKIHIDVLIKVRNEYFEQRNDTWTLLEELLKIDLDVDHCYYEPAKKVVDQLLHA